ncbi:hypothetical protein ACFPZL_11100 [Leucobacter soli]|uniref:Uncharacterized protein n=1 Tax=Leucobacter soli TaxID=2812850 RepID=A0A916JZR3_9MICO|nr:hypothetical protein [Leucobacter soli]CAG7613486.1 hypothetical protein LEUCIP111803_01700 [Leucobacter soli]
MRTEAPDGVIVVIEQRENGSGFTTCLRRLARMVLSLATALLTVCVIAVAILLLAI